jgi:hypothetical protein
VDGVTGGAAAGGASTPVELAVAATLVAAVVAELAGGVERDGFAVALDLQIRTTLRLPFLRTTRQVASPRWTDPARAGGAFATALVAPIIATSVSAIAAIETRPRRRCRLAKKVNGRHYIQRSAD